MVTLPRIQQISSQDIWSPTLKWSVAQCAGSSLEAAAHKSLQRHSLHCFAVQGVQWRSSHRAKGPGKAVLCFVTLLRICQHDSCT